MPIPNLGAEVLHDGAELLIRGCQSGRVGSGRVKYLIAAKGLEGIT